jgi:hypothetical protein
VIGLVVGLVAVVLLALFVVLSAFQEHRLIKRGDERPDRESWWEWWPHRR